MTRRTVRQGGVVFTLGLALLAVRPAGAADWPSLASDRLAAQVGDSLTVLIYEQASASNSAQNGASKTTHLSAQASTKPSRPNAAELNLASAYDGVGQTGRSDQMVAQISVTVVGVRPNGDLDVAGEQTVTLNGEHTHIKVKGAARRADIASNNTIISPRLADAAIDYSGSGLVSRAAKPGLVNRVLSRLGVF